MPYYSGKVQAKDLYATLLNLITAVQPGQSQPWWRNESSIGSDGAITSTGSTGTERIVLVIRESVVGQKIAVGIARDYTPGAINTPGTFQNLEVTDMFYYNSVQSNLLEVSYDLHITPDRIILHLQGDKLVNGWRNPVAYLGMPIRYDINDKTCVIKALSEGNNLNGSPTMLKDAANNYLVAYNWYYTQNPMNPAWGNTHFLEPLHLGLGSEGLRCELDCLYGLAPGGSSDNDEIDIAGVKYKVITRTASGYNAFPRATLALRKS